MLRRELDSEEGRYQLFEEFIARHHACLIPDFWTWDGTVSPTPYRKSLDTNHPSTVQRIRA